MANYLRIYLLDMVWLAAVPAPSRQWNPVELSYSEPTETSLLEWVEAKRELAASEKGWEDYLENDILGVLVSGYEWEDGAPGLDHVVDIRRLGIVLEDLEKIAAALPKPLRDRFVGGGNAKKADFPPNLPASSPIRALDLPGWQFFRREELEALKQSYEKVDKDKLGIEDDEHSEWNFLFEEHDEHPDYDFALFWWEV